VKTNPIAPLISMLIVRYSHIYLTVSQYIKVVLSHEQFDFTNVFEFLLEQIVTTILEQHTI